MRSKIRFVYIIYSKHKRWLCLKKDDANILAWSSRKIPQYEINESLARIIYDAREYCHNITFDEACKLYLKNSARDLIATIGVNK